MKKSCTVGIDLGGTKIYFALVDENGEILYEFRHNTGASGGEDLLSQLTEGTKVLLKEAEHLSLDVKAIGIGSPGRIDVKNGIVEDCTPNIKNWQGTNIKKAFAENFSIPVFIDNDANVAAYGEYYLRKKKGYAESTIIILTLGTGLGSGIIYNDELFRGKGLGSEIGHMLIEAKGRPCNCGQTGCIEMYVSGTALEIQANNRIINYPDSSLNQVENITSHEIFANARKNDLFSSLLIDEMAEYLGYGLISLINIFDPNLILLAGGISQQHDLFMNKVTNLVDKHINYNIFDKNIIQIAQSNDKAGLIGAGLIAFHGYEKGEI